MSQNDDAPATGFDLPWRSPLRPSALAARRPTPIDVAPEDPALLRAIADWAGLSSLHRLRLKGEMTPEGRADWRLDATLTAEVVQPCVVTLAPVTTAIDEPVTRRYVAGLADPEGDEIEIPEDTDVERLPPVIDLGAVALEALELAIPLYPRAPGAETAAAPTGEPTGQDVHRPFAALKDLLPRNDDPN